MAVPALTPTALRAHVVALLSGATDAGDRVYDSRRISIDDDDGDLPAISVYHAGTAREDIAGPWWRETTTILIAGYATAKSDLGLAAAVETLEGQILDLILSDPDLAAAVEEVGGASSDIDPSVSEKRRVAVTLIRLPLRYSMNRSQDVSGAGDLDALWITTDTTAPDGADVSAREIEL